MKLILLQDVEDLGLAGEEIHVASGYARNFLIPRNLAATATKAALRQLAAHKEKIEAKRKEELEAAQKLAEKIGAITAEIQMQASEDGHLFGSVTDRMIADAVKAQGIEVDHQRIHLDKPIRTLGEFSIVVKLHTSVAPTLKVNVVKAS